MTVQLIDRGEVIARAAEILGLDHEAVDLFSTPGLCASLRRAASFLCPASPRQIVDAVFDALAPLSEGLERGAVAEALDALVACGDLLELRQTGGHARMLFLAPPCFVEKHAGEYLLLGIRPGAVALLENTETELELIYDAHTRSVLIDPISGAATLTAAGLHCMSKEQWIRAPRSEPAVRVIEKVREALGAEKSAPGPISGLTIIDPAQPVHFYKRRWREPTSVDNGIFTGRRPQAYGAPIWCVVEISAGLPHAVLDLPVDSTVSPGWDEARRLQSALDAENGTPQIYRVRVGDEPGGSIFFDFFGPLPSWAERFLAISGRPVTRGPRSLFSYSLPSAAVDDAQRFLSISLWMKPLKEGQEV